MDYRVLCASVLLIGGAVGLLMPSDDGGPDLFALDPAPNAAEQAHALAMLDTADDVTWAEEVALGREPDGHFYANVMVDGVASRMLVDTGASVVALTGEDALAMGLQWDNSAIVPVAQGANGAVYGVPAQLRRVSVGSFEAEDVQAVIIPEGLGISLLGQSFLSTVEQVQIADDHMVLAN